MPPSNSSSSLTAAFGQSLHARDAVGDLEHAPTRSLSIVGVEALDVLAQRRGDVVGVDVSSP